MATLRGSYPHPVLDDSDDVAATFSVLNVSVVPTVEDVEVRFEVKMTDPDIDDLLQIGKAQYRFRWTCSSTIDNGSLEPTTVTPLADSRFHRGWIDQQRIRGLVRVNVTIVATDSMPEYRLSGQHSDYQGACFHLRPGDLIADAGYFEFESDKMYDPLDPPLASCFEFQSDEQVNKGIRVFFYDTDRVLVRFSPQLYRDFASLRDRPELQISLVVLPALIETIHWIQQNQTEEAQENRWLSVISSLMDEGGDSHESPLVLAQKILGYQLDKTLVQLTDGDDD